MVADINMGAPMINDIEMYSVVMDTNMGLMYAMVMHVSLMNGMMVYTLAVRPGFNGLGKDNCKTRRETFKC